MSAAQWTFIGITGVIAAGLTGWVRRYALNRGLLDHPGPRRSHAQSVPRGGGLAIMLAWCAGMFVAVAAGWIRPGWLAGLLVPAGLLALTGWLDDHRPLSVRLRLAVQFLTAGIALAIYFQSVKPDVSGLLLPVFLFALMWHSNLFNFMDGSHGMAAGQAIFVALAYMLLSWRSGEPEVLLISALLAAACAGFLPWNFPSARIFMGDVASVPLGFMLAGLGIYAWTAGIFPLPVLILLLSVFLVDASLTLINRIRRGQEWYTAHTEHAYQRLISSGWSHQRTCLAYQSVNLLAVVPAAWLIIRYPEWSWTIAAGVLGLEALLWWMVYSKSFVTQEQ